MNADGNRAQLQDFAESSVQPREREVGGRVASGEAVEIAVYREADANIVAVSRLVRDQVFGTVQQQSYVKDWQVKKDKGEVDDDGLPTAAVKQGKAKKAK